jgi:hypothetical protein
MNDCEDNFDLENEVQLAMEEISNREKDVRQLIQVANCLFERNQEM